MTGQDRKIAWGVFALLLASYAYFYQGGGWNESSRLDLVRAIVDDHTLAIDRYHLNTGDKASFRGHYYSDKAPGLSLLGVPIYGAVSLIRSFFHSEHDFVVFAAYVVTVLTVGVAGAALGALLYRAGRKLGASREGALVAAVGYGLGTAAFPLSTMFFSHQVAALLLFSSFLLSWEAGDARDTRRSIVIVALASAAVLVELPTAPAAALMLLFHTRYRLPKRAGLVIAAALVPIVGLAAYLTIAFGSPFRIGYDVLANPAARAEMHSHGLFGVTYPKLSVLAELLFGRYRGLLPYSPLLALAIPGYSGALLYGHGATGTPSEIGAADRRALFVALGVVIYFLLFVSSYEWWEGGASFGSRHLAPMLPFLALPVGLVASRRLGLSVGLLVASVTVMLVATAVQPKPSDWIHDPFWADLLPSFARGDLALTRACPAFGSPNHPGHHPFVGRAPYDAFNLGMALGGRGLKSLVPLLSLWITSAWALGRATRATA